MTIQVTESIWLNTSDICSLEHLIEVSGLTRNDMLNLIEAGVLEPSNEDPANYFFRSECIVLARTARRLRDDFELDAHGIALAMSLLHRIDELEAELASMRAKLAKPTRL